ncbi:hypothetical protein [Scytonema sp. PCC 10023]
MNDGVTQAMLQRSRPLEHRSPKTIKPSKAIALLMLLMLRDRLLNICAS